MKHLLFAALLFALGWAGSAAADRPDPHTRPLPVNVNIRAEPSLKAERIATLERGQAVWVYGQPTEDGWVQVSDAQKTIHGWMAAYLLDRPANKATPARRSAFAEAMSGSGPGSGGGSQPPASGRSLFSRELGGDGGGSGTTPTPATGGSLFAQASQSGEIERAQEQRRQREAEEARRQAEEARRRAEEEERLRREAEAARLQREWEEAEERRRWQEEEEERRYRDELAWAQAAADAEADRQRRWNMIQGIQQGYQQQIQQRQRQLADLQRAQAEQHRLQQQQQQRAQQQRDQDWQRQQAETERRRQQEAERQRRERELREQQARAAAQIQQATQPRASTAPPRPAGTTTTTASLPREQPQRGCWATPDPPNTTCVRSSARWGQGMNRDRFIVTHENVCSERIVVSMCNDRSGGQPICGQAGIMPGRSYNWDSYKDSTGGYSVRWVGSRNGSEDWSCISQIGWRN